MATVSNRRSVGRADWASIQATGASDSSCEPIVRVQQSRLARIGKVFSSQVVMQPVAIAFTVGSVSTVHSGTTSGRTGGS